MPESESSASPGEATKVVSYRVICISMYVDDLRALDDMVRALKARGLGRANRSALIRTALDRLDLDQVEHLR